MLALVVAFISTPLFAADEIPSVNPCHAGGNSAVRPRSAIVIAAIEFGIKRSPTLADEFDQLQRSDIVAYVEAARVAYSGVAGYVTFVSKTTMCRYVHITLTPHLNLSQMAALLGHELQHVLEIAAHPEVVDAESLSEMYERVGRHSHHERSYESAEAIEAGLRVQNELFGLSVKSSPAETER
jgi:hypothetical protein